MFTTAPTILSVLGGVAPPQTVVLCRGASPPWPPVLNFSENRCCGTCSLEVYTIFGPKNRGSVYYFRIWKPWKCILCSDLKTLQVYTTFASENLGSLYSSRIWKPWKCILLSDPKTLEVYTIFGIEKPWKCILFSGLKALEVYTIFGTENLGSV